jgi:hypothetical protein
MVQRSWLRPSHLIGPLSTVAVGLALSASSSPVILRWLGGNPPSDPPGWGVELPTLFFGVLWARGVRSKRCAAATNIRLGWLASVPLAAANAGVAAAVCLRHGALDSGSIGMFLAGATIGAIVWFPALIVTLVCFGIPIAWAQKAAARGLMGEERGYAVVGLTTVAMSVFGLVLSFDGLGRSLAVAGIASGGLAAGLAFLRERRRARFVAKVAKGEVPDFRLEETLRGRSLVRTSPGGTAYRVSTFDEEVNPLDAVPVARRLAAS